jgi:hypothetical protein
MLEVAV